MVHAESEFVEYSVVKHQLEISDERPSGLPLDGPYFGLARTTVPDA